MDKPPPKDPDKPQSGIPRREFLAYCTNAVLITLAYRAFSVFGDQDPPLPEGWRPCRKCQSCLGCVQATSVRG